MEIEGWARRETVPARRSQQRGTLRRTPWGVLAVVLAHVAVTEAGEGRALPNFATLIHSTAPLPRDGQKRVWTSLDRPLRGGYCEETPQASPTVLPSETSTAPTPRFSAWGCLLGTSVAERLGCVFKLLHSTHRGSLALMIACQSMGG
jgi:hypothetical protein